MIFCITIGKGNICWCPPQEATGICPFLCPCLAKMYGSVYSKIAMPDRKFTVLDLLDLDLKAHNSLDLNCLCGRKGLVRVITVPDLNRPGLALTGFYDSFAYDRVQLFGRGEIA